MNSTICAATNCPTYSPPESDDYINAECGHETPADSDPKCSVCGSVTCEDCLEYNSGMCEYCRVAAEKEDDWKIEHHINLILVIKQYLIGVN